MYLKVKDHNILKFIKFFLGTKYIKSVLYSCSHVVIKTSVFLIEKPPFTVIIIV